MTLEEQQARYKAAQARMYAAAQNVKPKPPPAAVRVIHIGERQREISEAAIKATIASYPPFKPHPRGESTTQAVERIKREVCAGREVGKKKNKRPMTPADLNGPRQGRGNPIVEARWFAMWRCRTELGLSFPRIGEYFGGRHHTSAMHAVRQVEAARKSLAA
jgi:hypothetical protein